MLDGRRAIMQTFMGSALASPGQMPFRETGWLKAAKTKGNPPARPEPPYFLVWHSETEFKGGPPLRLSRETRTQLRAVGYIQ